MQKEGYGCLPHTSSLVPAFISNRGVRNSRDCFPSLPCRKGTSMWLNPGKYDQKMSLLRGFWERFSSLIKRNIKRKTALLLLDRAVEDIMSETAAAIVLWDHEVRSLSAEDGKAGKYKRCNFYLIFKQFIYQCCSHATSRYCHVS